MTAMRLRNLLTSAVMVGASLTFVGAAAPAGAAIPSPVVEAGTTTVLTASKTVGEYGQYVSFDADVTSTNPAEDYIGAGGAELQRLLPGSSTWETVATDASAGYVYFPMTTFTGNASYRVFYTGGLYDSYPNDVAFAPSYSNVVTLSTYRSVDVKDVTKRKTGPRGLITVKPGFANKKFAVQVLVKGKWKAFKSAKTNAAGKVTLNFKGSRKGIPYRVVVPADKQFVQTVTSQFKAYRY